MALLVYGCTTTPDQFAPSQAYKQTALVAPDFLQNDCGITAPCVVMVLSPRMVYALKEFPRMSEAAQRIGMRVVPYRDGRVPEAEWQAAQAQTGLPVGHWRVWPTQALPSLRMTNHAPTSAVMAQGRVHPWPIHGVMPNAAWQHLLQARMDQLKAMN